MRAEAVWELADKTGRVWARIIVREGEQPYYTARHIGFAAAGGSSEIIAYGIGKKLHDGSMLRVWLMPDGTVCGGDDVEEIGLALARLQALTPYPPEEAAGAVITT